jgi:hypothetical protein
MMGGGPVGKVLNMVVFRRVIGVPLNTMIIQIPGKGKDKDRVM